MSNQNPTPPLTEEEVEFLRHKYLADMPAQFRFANTPPPISRFIAVIKKNLTNICVFALLVDKGLTLTLIEEKATSAYELWSPSGGAIVKVVSDYVGKIERHEIDPSSFSPSKDFIVIGKDAILPPDPPKVTPPPGSISGVGAMLGVGRISFTATGTLTGGPTKDAILPPEPPKLMLPPEPITGLRLGAVIDAKVGAATANSVATFTRPIVIASSGLPSGSIELMEKLATFGNDLEVWEL